MKWKALIQRWVRFSAVGATGVIVQTFTLALLLRMTGLHYLVATAIAVEASVLHNFVWHRKWTWADRQQTEIAPMLIRFNLTTGLMSIIGNLAFMWFLVDKADLNANAANMLTIAFCSLINFVLSDRLVFV